MPVPDFQSIMLPLLDVCSDQAIHRFPEVRDKLAIHFALSDAERSEVLASGQPRFDNRVRWARTHLTKAGLLESPKWGEFRITSRGLSVLETTPASVSMKFLRQFTEYVDFVGGSSGAAEGSGDEASISDVVDTPQDLIDSGYRTLRKQLAH